MTTDTKQNLAHGSATDTLREVRRRLGWALGSALGVLMVSITATVISLESHSTSTLPGTSRVPVQGAYPPRPISDPSDGQVRALQSHVPSALYTGESISAIGRRT